MEMIITKKQENDQYKRMIDSIEEAMLVVQDDEVKFTNHIAKNVLKIQDEASEEEDRHIVINEKIFHVFKDNEVDDSEKS